MSPLRLVIAYLVYFFYRFILGTLRVKVYESEGLKALVRENKMFVVVLWHNELNGILYLVKPYRVACIVSQSKDGDLVAKVIELLGGKTARGSSTRGGVNALKSVLRLTKENWRPTVTVDGPRGPRHEVKAGALEIAKLLKIPVVAINMKSSRAWVFERAWDKAEIPKPFSRMIVTWGDPIWINDDKPMEAYQQEVRTSLLNNRKKAEDILNTKV